MGPIEADIPETQRSIKLNTPQASSMADQSIPSDDQLPQKYTPNFTYFQGFWCPSQLVPNITAFQNHFQALDDDIVLASKPKTGTTWLKALAFSILNRHRFPLSNSPLASPNPHDLVPYFDMTLYNNGCHPDFADVSSPRLFATHLPYHALAESIKNPKARIVYAIGLAPFWAHVLDYRKQSTANPNKVLFLKYEEMKGNPVGQIKKVAEFMGCPFSEEEEKAGAIDEIAEFCSLSNLKNLELNKSGSLKTMKRQTNSFLRKGDCTTGSLKQRPGIASRGTPL
ncbi:cytosolic sulfotransferase 14 [Gossypium hirsutum]|uniref:Sulfotransferase n=2 Tax=Gossypium TaxID=3633 RepID=A0ABM2YYS3_GOSHI|nr:cytosolic sulfotransferase 14-like [Gossypium hirsutum]